MQTLTRKGSRSVLAHLEGDPGPPISITRQIPQGLPSTFPDGVELDRRDAKPLRKPTDFRALVLREAIFAEASRRVRWRITERS